MYSLKVTEVFVNNNAIPMKPKWFDIQPLIHAFLLTTFWWGEYWGIQNKIIDWHKNMKFTDPFLKVCESGGSRLYY